MPDRFDEYLNTAGEQIRWKRARPAILNELRTRLEIALHPELDPLGGGYSGTVIQRVLEGSQWLGEGAWTGTRPYEQTMPACGGDFFLTTVLHKLGWLPFLLLVLAVFALAGWMLARCLKQKNTLARLTVLAVVLPLTLQPGGVAIRWKE